MALSSMGELGNISFISSLSYISSIVSSSSECAKKALTIAIRYSTVRRQFPSSEGDSVEMQIMDYQSHQHRLLPLLAGAYAFHFTGVQMKKHYDAFQKEVCIFFLMN